MAAIATQTLEVIDSKTNRVGAVAADEPPVPVGDHRSLDSADRAIWADNDKSRIGLNYLHLRVA